MLTEFGLILTSATRRFSRVSGVAFEEAADPPGLSEDWRSRQEPFPKRQTHRKKRRQRVSET